ncbi:restriction endonuclease [Lysinibacillus antri]|uniref:Restriction endonuclease n=1 Tax=Lysinibacillus antri TaxID=2498145 RepID=A0A3S0WG16_9BACI|nr:restriction endonuclease [Lysinibacillus antri]RUL51918.1 restriction endonuclease [Lysinibacillus antri]
MVITLYNSMRFYCSVTNLGGYAIWTFIIVLSLILIALLLIFFVIGYSSIEKGKSEKLVIETKLESCKKEVIRYRNRLSANKKATQIIYNFFMKYDPEIFNSSYHIMVFERYLYKIYPNSRMLLWSDGYNTTPYSNNDHSTPYPNNEKIRFFQPIESFEKDIQFRLNDKTLFKKTERFYKEEFSQLLEIIKSYEEFRSTEIASLTLWLLLREEAIKYYSDIFSKRYEEKYFNNLSNLDSKQCIEIFLKYIWRQDKSSEELIDIIEKKKKSTWEFFYTEDTNTILFTCFLMQKKKIKLNNLLHADSKIKESFQAILFSEDWIKRLKKNKVMDFENFLLNNDSKKASSSTTIHEVDLMNGIEFENFINDLFKKMGYDSEVTKASGDQGIDIITKKNGKSFGIQAKCYSNVVSNKAVQEVVAGLNYYKLDQGIVITNNKFTKSAEDLARANNILLWDREILKDKINTFMKR